MKLKQLLLAFASMLPLAGTSAITFSSNTTLGVGNTAYDGQDIIVSNCTLTVNGPHGFASLRLTSNAVVTCDALTTGLVVTVTSDLVVESTCAITVLGKGWTGTDTTGNGPGGGGGARWLDRIGGSGAGHGGEGGLGSSGYAAGGGYGAWMEPATWGSAGGAGTQIQGASGGGAIRLQVGGALHNDGLITANGANGATHAYGAAGGGAGGSIWITAQTLAGAGRFSADGGSGGASGRGNGGGGGGGRVAVYCATNFCTGQFTALGGWGYQYGGAGTVFLKLADQPAGTLCLDNGGNAGAKTTTPAGSWTFADLIGRGRARFELCSNTCVNLLTPVFTTRTNFELNLCGQLGFAGDTNGCFARVEIVDGGCFTNAPGSRLRCAELRAADGGSFVLNYADALECGRAEALAGGTLLLNRPATFERLRVATNGLVSLLAGATNLTIIAASVVVDAGGRISVDGKGHPGTDGRGGGPGGGEGQRWVDWIGGGGGGYGGAGGDSSSGHRGGGTYGSLAEPVAWGSAGGAASQTQGSAGGGALRLVVGGPLEVHGEITANGLPGVVGSYGAGGGGSGGSLWITATTLTGTGRIAADGGACGVGPRGTGGGGGGGRIAVDLATNLFTGVLTTSGAAGYRSGTNGTHYRFVPPPRLSLARSGALLRLTWPSESWLTYEVLMAETPGAATWTVLTPPLPGTGGVLATNVPLGPAPAQFFRLRQTE